MSSEKLMTPAEIERAVKEACAKACEGMQYCDPQPHHYAAAIRALPPMFGDVPAGWRLVPVDPTDEMVGAAGMDSEPFRSVYQVVKRTWDAMIAAAPTAGQAAAKDAGVAKQRNELLAFAQAVADSEIPEMVDYQYAARNLIRRTGDAALPTAPEAK